MGTSSKETEIEAASEEREAVTEATPLKISSFPDMSPTQPLFGKAFTNHAVDRSPRDGTLEKYLHPGFRIVSCQFATLLETKFLPSSDTYSYGKLIKPCMWSHSCSNERYHSATSPTFD